ncbi:hypothetical protein ES288_A10G134900v1 [Gossypium darwinii]|nr:hypothetical protein ES288_A10G134900v1 [Gossypium darwinii]
MFNSQNQLIVESISELQKKVKKRMKKPIYVYYQLDNFYQNHRRHHSISSSWKSQGLALIQVECYLMLHSMVIHLSRNLNVVLWK